MIWRWLEFVTLFLVIPVGLYIFRSNIAHLLLPILCLLAAYCCHHLLQSGVLKQQWMAAKNVNRQLVMPVFMLFVPLAMLALISINILVPEKSFNAPFSTPFFWVVILLLYPLFSVLPQELIFRTFFFYRYREMFPSHHSRLVMSSACFGFAHLLYANWVAVVLSFFGGLILGYRYVRSGSTAVVVLEHSLWGIFLFTSGLGTFFVASQSL